MKALICKIIGHRFNKDSLEHGVSSCDRCGDSDYGYGVVAWTLESRFFYRKWRLKLFASRVLSKIRNRKDDDGLPF